MRNEEKTKYEKKNIKKTEIRIKKEEKKLARATQTKAC
jgi:hypothetical protein